VGPLVLHSFGTTVAGDVHCCYKMQQQLIVIANNIIKLMTDSYEHLIMATRI
jgi:hypothetical protein